MLTLYADVISMAIRFNSECCYRLQFTFTRDASCIGTFSRLCIFTRWLVAIPDGFSVLVCFFVLEGNDAFVLRPPVVAVLTGRELTEETTT